MIKASFAEKWIGPLIVAAILFVAAGYGGTFVELGWVDVKVEVVEGSGIYTYARYSPSTPAFVGALLGLVAGSLLFGWIMWWLFWPVARKAMWHLGILSLRYDLDEPAQLKNKGGPGASA